MQFDTNFPHYSNKEKQQLRENRKARAMRKNVPAAAAAVAKIVEAGGAISKPLILLLQE